MGTLTHWPAAGILQIILVGGPQAFHLVGESGGMTLQKSPVQTVQCGSTCTVDQS